MVTFSVDAAHDASKPASKPPLAPMQSREAVMPAARQRRSRKAATAFADASQSAAAGSEAPAQQQAAPESEVQAVQQGPSRTKLVTTGQALSLEGSLPNGALGLQGGMDGLSPIKSYPGEPGKLLLLGDLVPLVLQQAL